MLFFSIVFFSSSLNRTNISSPFAMELDASTAQKFSYNFHIARISIQLTNIWYMEWCIVHTLKFTFCSACSSHCVSVYEQHARLTIHAVLHTARVLCTYYCENMKFVSLFRKCESNFDSQNPIAVRNARGCIFHLCDYYFFPC